MSSLRRPLLLLLASTVFSVLLLELGLRVATPFTNNPLFLPEKIDSSDETVEIEQRLEQQRGTRLFGVPVNSLGFRDREFVMPKPDDAFRIVVLADSFGVMAVVPDTHLYLNLLETQLAGLSNARKTEILNLGIPAIGPHHYLAVLKRFGLWLEPDLVVVCVFVGNDFNPAPIEQVFESRFSWLLSYRIGARLMRLSGAELSFIERDTGEPARPTPTPDWVDDWRLEPATMQPEEFLAIAERRARNFDSEVPETRFEHTIEYLRRIQQIATRETGRPLVVVLIPDQMQVDPELQRIVEERVGRSLDLDRPSRYLEAALGPDRFVLIDLLPVLREAHRELGRVYHLRDTHWNANGNRVAAEEIASRLRNERALLAP